MKKFDNEIDTKDNSNITILPLEVANILNFEVRIAEYSARDNIRDIRVRHDYLNISNLIKKISEGYFITPYGYEDPVTPFYQQVYLIEYWYGNNPDFKQELKGKNIFPTFIIEHGKGGDLADEETAVLGYCFIKPITDGQFADDIFNALCKKIFNSKFFYDDEIDFYTPYDYGNITNLTISNNVYVAVKGDSYGE